MAAGFGPRDKAFIRAIYEQALTTAQAKGVSGEGAEGLAMRTAATLASRGLGKPVFLEDVRRLVAGKG